MEKVRRAVSVNCGVSVKFKIPSRRRTLISIRRAISVGEDVLISLFLCIDLLEGCQTWKSRYTLLQGGRDNDIE